MKMYLNRAQAGQELAQHLSVYAACPDVLLLAVSRGGIFTAIPMALRLFLPLDIVVTMNITSILSPEITIGAISQDGTVVLEDTAQKYIVDIQKELRMQYDHIKKEVQRRSRLYRNLESPPEIRGKHVILVDEGIATSAHIKTAIYTATKLGAEQITISAPIGAEQIVHELDKMEEVTQVVVPLQPYAFGSVGQYYEHYEPITDTSVLNELDRYTHYWNTMRTSAMHALTKQ